MVMNKYFFVLIVILGNSVYYCCLDNCYGEKCVNRKKHGYFNDSFPEDLENFLYESRKQKK
jgi:hypothetical protein